MTRNKARKSAIRQRMAETGEPYSVARSEVGARQAEAGAPEITGITPEDEVTTDEVTTDERDARETEAAAIGAAESGAQRPFAWAQELAELASHAAGRAQERARPG